MPRLPQAIIRQRTRQDLLRQRQQQLKQRIEQPTPQQPQATPQEIVEYQRLKQQYDEQQSRLQEAISNVEREMEVNLTTFQRMKEAIARKEAEHPEWTLNVAKREAAEYANRYEDLKIRLSHLKGSQSVEEASLFGSYYKGRRAEELGRQAEQRLRLQQPQIPISPVSEIYKQEVRGYQEQGFSKSEAEYLTRRGSIEKVSYFGEGARQILRERGTEAEYRFAPQMVTELGRPILTAREQTVLGGGYLSSLYSQAAMTERQVAEAVSGVQPQYITDIKYKGIFYAPPETKTPKFVGQVGGGALFPTKEGEELVRKQLAKTRPGRYELARIEKMSRRSEDEFNVYETISGGFWKTSEFLAEKTISAFKKAGISTSLLEKEITLPGWARAIPGHLAIWILFSPTMGSGAAAQELMYAGKTKLVYDYVKGKWVRVDKITGKVIPEMTRAEALGEFSRLSEQRQLEILRKAFKQVKDESGNILKRVYLDKASLLKDINKAKDFMRNAGLSEAQIEARINLLFPKLKPRPPTQIQAEIQAQMPQQLVGIDWLGAGTSVVQAEAVGQVQFQQFRQPLISGLALRSELAQRELQRARQRQLFFQPQVSRQIALQRQAYRQLYRQITPQITKQVPVLKQPTLLKRVPTRRITRPIPKLKPFFPIPPLSEASIEKVKKALAELKGRGVDVSVGMEKGKKKIVYKNLPPKLALKKAQEYVDQNIQASFKLVKSGKKPKKKDIKSVTMSPKFRLSKRDPLYQVERRAYRLDMPGEKKQIQRAKKVKWV